MTTQCQPETPPHADRESDAPRPSPGIDIIPHPFMNIITRRRQEGLQGQVRHVEEQLSESRQLNERPPLDHDASSSPCFGDTSAASHGMRHQELQCLIEHAQVTETRAPAFGRWLSALLLLLALWDARQHQGTPHLTLFQEVADQRGLVRRRLDLGNAHAEDNACSWSETARQRLLCKAAFLEALHTKLTKHYWLLTLLHAQEAGPVPVVAAAGYACSRTAGLRFAAASEENSAVKIRSGGLLSLGQDRRSSLALLLDASLAMPREVAETVGHGGGS